MDFRVADAHLFGDLSRRPVGSVLGLLGLHHLQHLIDYLLAQRSFPWLVVRLLQQSIDATLVEPTNDHADGYGMNAKDLGDLTGPFPVRLTQYDLKAGGLFVIERFALQQLIHHVSFGRVQLRQYRRTHKGRITENVYYVNSYLQNTRGYLYPPRG